MKKFFMVLFSKAAEILEQEPATRDRSTAFRFAVVSLLAVSILYVVYYTIATR